MAVTTGKISGTVTNVSGKAPIEGIEVCAFSVSAEGFGCATTGSGGEYTISSLPSEEYYVEFHPPFESKLDYILQYYSKASSFAGAQGVLVAAGSTRSGVNAELEEGAQISGNVTRALAGKTAIKGIAVCAVPTNEKLEGENCTKTGASGEYTIVGLASGEYHVEFSAPFEGGLDYVTQYYSHKRLRSEAQAVSVTAPGAKAGVNATEINAELEEGGRITGKVTDASTGAVLEGVLVCAREGSGETPLGQCALTHSGGEYTISSLASGNYKVGFNVHEYVTQYYSGKSLLSEAQLVSVTAPNTTPGIDAALQRSGAPPVNTTPPVVSGTPAVGASLLCANGLWTGKPAPTFTQLWLRDGVPISGALGSSYVVQGADAGHRISCLVIAKNARGEKSALSASIAIPSPPPPPPPPTPVVTSMGSKLVVSGKAIKMRLTCAAAACRGSVVLTLQVVVKRHRGRKTISRRATLVLAKGSFSLAQGRSATVSLRLTSAGRKRLAHARRHPVVARLTVLVQGGRTTTKSVLVR